MMKKIAPYLFPLGYACAGGLLASCVSHMMGYLSPFGITGHTLRFLAVCLLLTALAVAATVVLVIANYNLIPEGKSAKLTLIIEVIESALLFLPAFGLWMIPLDLLADLFLK